MPEDVIPGETPALFFCRLWHPVLSGEACLQSTENLSGLSERAMTDHTHIYTHTAQLQKSLFIL